MKKPILSIFPISLPTSVATAAAIAICFSAFGLLNACGGSSSGNNTPVPDREGAALSGYDPIYFDGNASLDNTGSKIAFVSRRLLDGANPLKAYKADFALNATAAPTLSTVTSSDIGNEVAVKISPDGAWLAVVTWGEKQTAAGEAAEAAAPVSNKVYLFDYAGSKSPIPVELPSAGIISDIDFSTDSKMLVINSTALADGKGLILLADTSTLQTVQTVAAKQLTADDQSEYHAQFRDGVAPYSLLSAGADGKLYLRQFASYAAAPSQQAGTVFSTSQINPMGKLAVTTSRVINLTQLPDSSRKIALFKDNQQSTETTFEIENDVSISDYSGNSAASASSPLGLRIYEMQGTRQADVLASIVNLPYQCGANIVGFGRTLHVGTLENSELSSRYFIAKNAEGNWEGLTAPCGEITDYSKFDHTLSNIVINQLVTPSEFRILYVSRYTKDPEIMAMTLSAGKLTVLNISQNATP